MIDILLATYNGEKYIETQLLSLLMQTEKRWKLLVHDDGSTDNTLAIIQHYANIDSRIVIISDGITNLGPAGNFLHLLQFSNSQFIICCDQDDIWLDNKLEKLYNQIIMYDNSKPQAVYCNSYIYNSNNANISGTATLAHPSRLQDFLFLNSGIQGNSILFNSQLKEACLPIPNYVCMHDFLITLVAVLHNGLHYLPEKLMLYRQHNLSVTLETPSKIKYRILHFFDQDKSVIDFNHYLSTKSFCKTHSQMIQEKDMKIFEAYLKFPSVNLKKRLSILIIHRFSLFNSRVILLAKTLLRKAINTNVTFSN